MISLEQVRQLDIRVKKAVAALKALSLENETLKKRIAEIEVNLAQMQNEASARQADEQELEVSLQGVLDVLDEVDRETADIEPEPPSESHVVEASLYRDAETVEAKIANESPEQKDSLLSGENQARPEADEIAPEAESEPENGEEPLVVKSTDEKSPVDEAVAEDNASPEEIVLDEKPGEPGNGDQLQSEFDIF